MAERQDIPINEILPNEEEKDAMSETSAVGKKKEAKDTGSSNTVTKESEIHSDSVQIERAETLPEKAEIAVENIKQAKHTDTSEMVSVESESQGAEAVSEQAEITVETTQEGKVNENRETQEPVSEIAKLEKGSPIVDIEKETVLEIELGTSDLKTEPESNVVSIVPELNVLSDVNRFVICDTNIRKENVNDSENECAPPEVVFPKPVIPPKIMEGDTSDDSGMGESVQQSLQLEERHIPDITEKTETEQMKGMKRKFAEEEDAPEEPNLKHSTGAQRSEGPASFISKSPGYRKIFAEVFDLCRAARQEMLDVSNLEPHFSKILCWNLVDRLVLRSLKSELEILLGDNYLLHDEESARLETDDEDGGDRTSHTDSSDSSEPSDDFPKFISSGGETHEGNAGITLREGERSFQMTDDSDVQSDTETNLQFTIKKELAKMCLTGGLNLVKREQVKRNVSTEEPLPKNPRPFPAYSSCPVQKPQQKTSVYPRCTQASTQGSERQSHAFAAFDRDLPSFASFLKSDEQGRSESYTSAFPSTTQQTHASFSAKRTEQGRASTQTSQRQLHRNAAFDRDLASSSSFGKSDEQGIGESCTSSFSLTTKPTHVFSIAKRTEQGCAEMSTPNISTNPPPSSTPRQTTYTYLPASQEEKSKDSAGTLVGYYILKNSDKSIKLEMRYPGMENVSNSLIII